ncbi:DUF2723 domain-containing protein [Aureivirga sp. CE67]|uniref:DUF2723 domain-containing protein n=1 Tax=Aureivirga sp. CE67 TaxID=1788983 RepID=UPI0018CAD1A3|nr:DUF2723 domain-containing protein [Aureivirga sp. CE67]
MNSFTFRKLNNLVGWLVFLVALFTYVSTLEPTVSFWDSGEYISTSANLSVGHPPGSPMYQMLGAFISMFTTDSNQVAFMVNMLSAVASAFTILFLFWTISLLARKMVTVAKNKIFDAIGLAVVGSAAIGALTFTFSDSFWFNAVEAEVYAMSSFVTSTLFWLALKWEENFDEPLGNRWLLLISFVVGLSFGVHLLSLLVIPAVVLVYFFKKYKTISIKQFILGNIIAVLVLAFVFKFLFPYTLVFFSACELFFVNTIGLPFNSGTIIAGLILIAAFYFGLKHTRKAGLVLANTAVLCLLFTMIGFSSWMMIPIRANANTTINENNPSSARELLAYYNREQYGDANVFYDKYYNYVYGQELDRNQPYIDDKPKYEKDEKTGKYVIVNNYQNAKPNYSSKYKGFMPRMTNPMAIDNYKAIAGIDQRATRKPTFGENLKYMLSYQFNYMYIRYFLWNFVGKQNDLQGNMDIHNGNWISGINAVDSFFVGPQDNLPSDIKNNKGRNTYYGLPLILGIIGLLFHLSRKPKDFYTLFVFFIFMSLAIVFYVNQKAFEPRERDYSYVGSFYVFAIWVGFGVLAIYEKFKDKMPKKALAVGTTLVCLFLVPTIMAKENWNDHDRSNRYTALLNAKAYLDSCQENAILFSIGDNDTFPLWYMQEIEGYRRDVKVINSSLFATDWYIDQMKRQTFTAPPIPSSLTHDLYKYGSLEIAYHVPDSRVKDSVMPLSTFMKWIESKNQGTYIQEDNGHLEKAYPLNKIRIPVDKNAVLENHIVPAKDSSLIVPYIDITIDDRAIYKNRILMLDIINNNNWKRPIYFTGGASAAEEYIWMKDYLQLDGLAFKLVPIKTPNRGSILSMGRIDSDALYEKVKNWNWRNITDDNIYLDPESRRNSINFRTVLVRLADKFIEENKKQEAEAVLDLSLEKMPVDKFGHYSLLLGYVESYYALGNKEKARALADKLIKKCQENINYYVNFPDNFITSVYDELETNIVLYNTLVEVSVDYDSEEFASKQQAEFVKYMQILETKLQIDQ